MVAPRLDSAEKIAGAKAVGADGYTTDELLPAIDGGADGYTTDELLPAIDGGAGNEE